MTVMMTMVSKNLMLREEGLVDCGSPAVSGASNVAVQVENPILKDGM